jgi:hypothetical protein
MIRQAAAWAIVGTFAGVIVEIETAGPFRPIAWWRAPLTGGVILGATGALAWADRQIKAQP